MIDLLFIFTAGLLGSAHCIGMCGGFVLAVSQAGSRRGGLVHQAAYFFGKALTYAMLGAVAGGAGAALTMGRSGLQAALSITAGVLMIFIGLGLLGVFTRIEGFGRLAQWSPYQRAMGYFLRERSYSGSLGLGLLNGVLPCGLVYAMLVKAAGTGTVAAGAATMFLFGIATVPALFALGITGHLLRPLWRTRLNWAAGLVVIGLGVMMIVRGLPAEQGHQHEAHHHSPEVTTSVLN